MGHPRYSLWDTSASYHMEFCFGCQRRLLLKHQSSVQLSRQRIPRNISDTERKQGKYSTIRVWAIIIQQLSLERGLLQHGIERLFAIVAGGKVWRERYFQLPLGSARDGVQMKLL